MLVEDVHTLVDGVLEQVEVQLPLVLEIVEQQALGYTGPFGDGVGGGLFEAAVAELDHGAAADEVLALHGEVEKLLVHGQSSFPLHHTAIDQIGQPLKKFFLG